MEELIKVLSETREDVDFKSATNLVEDGVLDSLDIVNIIYGIEDHYGIEINPEDIDPDNFQSAEAIWNMVQRMKKN
jgi:acyl carrier protein